MSQQIKYVCLSVEARIGWLLIVECLFNCRQARLKFETFPMPILHQCQRKSKLSQVKWNVNVSTRHLALFQWRQFPVDCQIHLLLEFQGSTFSPNHIYDHTSAWLPKADCYIHQRQNTIQFLRWANSILWGRMEGKGRRWCHRQAASTQLRQPYLHQRPCRLHRLWPHQPCWPQPCWAYRPHKPQRTYPWY